MSEKVFCQNVNGFVTLKTPKVIFKTKNNNLGNKRFYSKNEYY